MRKYLCWLVFFFLFLQLGYTQQILGILGSSTAAGTGASPVSNSWVNRLTTKYVGEGKLSATVNLAVGGYNPYHAMPDGFIPPADRPAPDPEHNISQLLTESPDIVIVSFVSNQYNLYSFEEIRLTLTTIRDSALQAGAVCFITTPQPRTGFNVAARQKLRDLTDSVLVWFGEYAINFFDPLVNPADNTILPEYRYSGDQIHINNAGHEVLFNQVVAKNIIAYALPVKLEYFGVQLSEGKPRLNWHSTDEEMETLFTVERSTDGRTFIPVHQREALRHPGLNRYSFTDSQAPTGLNYYRLQLSEPGRVLYSPVRAVTVPADLPGRLTLYPNPAVQFIHLRLRGTVTDQPVITITDINGRNHIAFSKQLSEPDPIIRISVQHLPAGTYVVRVSDGSRILQRQFVKQ